MRMQSIVILATVCGFVTIISSAAQGTEELEFVPDTIEKSAYPSEFRLGETMVKASYGGTVNLVGNVNAAVDPKRKDIPSYWRNEVFVDSYRKKIKDDLFGQWKSSLDQTMNASGVFTDSGATSVSVVVAVRELYQAVSGAVVAVADYVLINNTNSELLYSSTIKSEGPQKREWGSQWTKVHKSTIECMKSSISQFMSGLRSNENFTRKNVGAEGIGDLGDVE